METHETGVHVLVPRSSQSARDRRASGPMTSLGEILEAHGVVESFAWADQFTPSERCVMCGMMLLWEKYGHEDYLVNGRVVNGKWRCPHCVTKEMP